MAFYSGKKWPAVPTPTPDEVYKGLSDQAKEYPLYLESILRQSKNFDKPENLDGVRVLDCSTNMLIGAYLSSLLAELGAEVIKIEPPTGDPYRYLTPFGRKDYMFTDRTTGEQVGAGFIHEMRNKYSVTLDLTKEEGREILKKLAVHADILIENAPPGQFDEWGIGYRQLSEINPRLIYTWVGQRGQWGPLKDKPGMLDPVAQAACGFVHGTGMPKEMGGKPTRSAMWMADYVGGAATAVGVLAALFYRDTVSGRGQFVEGTAAEGVIRILDYNWVWYGFDGSIRPRFGNWDLAINIYSVNPCKDGYQMIGGGHDRLWYRIWGTVAKDRPEIEKLVVEDPKLKVVTDRLTYAANVKACTLLSEWMKDKARWEAERDLLAEQVASGGVLMIDEVAEYPHFKYRGFIEEVDTPNYGPIVYGTTPFLQHRCPGRLKWLGRGLGQDNETIYRDLLGFTKHDLARLKKEGVI